MWLALEGTEVWGGWEQGEVRFGVGLWTGSSPLFSKQCKSSLGFPFNCHCHLDVWEPRLGLQWNRAVWDPPATALQAVRAAFPAPITVLSFPRHGQRDCRNSRNDTPGDALTVRNPRSKQKATSYAFISLWLRQPGGCKLTLCCPGQQAAGTHTSSFTPGQRQAYGFVSEARAKNKKGCFGSATKQPTHGGPSHTQEWEPTGSPMGPGHQVPRP